MSSRAKSFRCLLLYIMTRVLPAPRLWGLYTKRFPVPFSCPFSCRVVVVLPNTVYKLFTP